MTSAAYRHREWTRAGSVTIAVIVLACLAMDDITTDDAVEFKLEYTLLAACGVWCLFLVYHLLKHGYRGLPDFKWSGGDTLRYARAPERRNHVSMDCIGETVTSMAGIGR